MKSDIPPPLDIDLQALVDDRLSTADAARLESQLDDAGRARLAAWRQQNTQLRGLHADWLARPVPDALQQAAVRLDVARTRRRQRIAWGGMAAGWLLAFGLGWGLHARPEHETKLAAAPPTLSTPAQFVRQAALAYAIYQPEQRHPVEVGAAQEDHLVQWLSRRLGRALRVPTLQPAGFDLLGGRLLPGDDGARAQFMYQNAGGARVTLYVGAISDPDQSGETAFRFAADGRVQSFYWVDRGFGYALSGEMPRAQLQALAHAVYQQIGAPS